MLLDMWPVIVSTTPIFFNKKNNTIFACFHNKLFRSAINLVSQENLLMCFEPDFVGLVWNKSWSKMNILIWRVKNQCEKPRKNMSKLKDDIFLILKRKYIILVT